MKRIRPGLAAFVAAALLGLTAMGMAAASPASDLRKLARRISRGLQSSDHLGAEEFLTRGQHEIGRASCRERV